MISEDGHLYRWNLATNSLSQSVTLGSGVGEPYVPTVIGPDGVVYTVNGGTMATPAPGSTLISQLTFTWNAAAPGK